MAKNKPGLLGALDTVFNGIRAATGIAGSNQQPPTNNSETSTHKEKIIICEQKTESSSDISKALGRLKQDNANIDESAKATYEKLYKLAEKAGGKITEMDPVTKEPVDLYIHKGQLWMNRENTYLWVFPKDHSEKDRPLLTTPAIEAMGRVFLQHGNSKETKKLGTCDSHAGNELSPGNRSVASAEDNSHPVAAPGTADAPVLQS